jgi:hypothetical protein
VFRKRNREQFEGWWSAVPGSGSPDVGGKIEWEPSRDGGTELDLLVRGLRVPDGAEVQVVFDGRTVMSAPVERGRARKVIRSIDGHDVPNLAGAILDLSYQGQTLARTELTPD